LDLGSGITNIPAKAEAKMRGGSPYCEGSLAASIQFTIFGQGSWTLVYQHEQLAQTQIISNGNS